MTDERDLDLVGRCCGLKPDHVGCCAFRCSHCGGAGDMDCRAGIDDLGCTCGLCDGYGGCPECQGWRWHNEDGDPCYVADDEAAP